MLMDRRTAAESALLGREIIRQNVDKRFEKIQYDLLQEKLRQTPIIPVESGEQTDRQQVKLKQV